MKNIILTTFVMSFIGLNAQIGGKNFIDQNYIEVTGKAEMEVVPNEIYLKIVIDEKDFNRKQTVAEMEKKMIAKLKKMKINVSEKLTIRDMVSNFQHYWLRGSAIQNRKEYQLLVHSANEGGYVFQVLEAIGISRVSVDRVEHSDIQKFRSEVKVNAVKVAKEKATLMLQAIGQKAGKAIFIQELDTRYRNPDFSNTRMKRNALNVGGGRSEGVIYKVGVEFQKIKLKYSVLARFEISQ